MKNIIKWILSAFFLFSAIVYFPSVASVFMAILGVFYLPINAVQKFVKTHLRAGWLRILVAFVLFLLAIIVVPTDSSSSSDTTLTQTPGEVTTQAIVIATKNVPDPTVTISTHLTATPTATITPTPKPTVTPTAKVSTPPVASSFKVHFIDVGQADAALVVCDGRAMLIDGGNVGDSSKLYAYLKEYNIAHLDYVIATHAHEDHIGGIAGALNYASVDKVYCPVTSYSSDAFNNFVKAVKKHGISITVPKTGTTFSLGSAHCKILAANTSSDTNNSSIVMRITYGETSFLFTGDAEREVEQAILNREETLSSTVLKVGHHGSDTSTSYVWLREIMPEYAVISVGSNNSYGHPTEVVLSRLRDADVKTFRTDMQGHIICVSDGKVARFTVSRNADADTFGGIGDNSTQKKENASTNQQEFHYILNINTKKFHEVNCKSVNQMNEKNKQDFYGTRQEIVNMGYSACGICKP